MPESLKSTRMLWRRSGSILKGKFVYEGSEGSWIIGSEKHCAKSPWECHCSAGPFRSRVLVLGSKSLAKRDGRTVGVFISCSDP